MDENKFLSDDKKATFFHHFVTATATQTKIILTKEENAEFSSFSNFLIFSPLFRFCLTQNMKERENNVSKESKFKIYEHFVGINPHRLILVKPCVHRSLRVHCGALQFFFQPKKKIIKRKKTKLEKERNKSRQITRHYFCKYQKCVCVCVCRTKTA